MSDLIDEFIETREKMLKTHVKECIKKALFQDLKKIIEIAINQNKINIADSLNETNIDDCRSKPNEHKSQADEEYLSSDEDDDILENLFDLSADDQDQQDSQIEQ